MADDPGASRRILGIVQATVEYCPGVQARSGVLGLLYQSAKTPEDEQEVASSKEAAFVLLRGARSRDVACELMMKDYGPGAPLHLFAFK